MSATAIEDIVVTPLGPGIGAQIDGVNLREALSPATREHVMAAWLQHKVLRFRGQQGMSTQQLVDFSKNFGELDRAPTPANKTGKPYLAEFPNVTAISNIVIDGQPIGGLGSYEAEWHTDMSYNESTPSASILYAIEIPPSGGDTWFCDMYAVYDALPAQLKTRIANLKCVHDASRNSAGMLRKGWKEVADPRETIGALHPIVRTHPITQRKALFLGRRLNAYIPGLSLDESEALLDALWQHAVRSEVTWVQQWKIGDVLIWDNRCTMHRRDSFDAETRRLMHRTQIAGDRPY
ncbi:MAG: TauD/TfdA family dioxygenase [Betaproteobacteria bacterium]|nr:TauD/TfdA family dioxygenase [Betaproteobacteria bacterium]